MSIKVLPHLRFLNPSLPANRLLPPKFAPSSSPAIPIFSRIFPSRLEYSTLSPQFSSQPGVRRLSTRPFRSGGSGSGRGGRDRGEVRASKSLIEDEADLSNWASDLRVHSSGGGRFSSDDRSDYSMNRGGRFEGGRGRGGERGRGRGGERARGRGGGRGGGRNGGDEEQFSMRRTRESDSDDFRESNPSSRGGRGGAFSRGGRGGAFSRGGRGESSFRGGRVESFSRNSGGSNRFDRGSRESLGSDSDEGRFNSRGNVSSMNGRRGRGGVDFRSKRDGVGLMRKKEITDDDEDSENDDDSVSEVEDTNGLTGSFGGLITEEESDAEEEGDDGEDAVSSLGLEKKFSVKERPSSPEESASYLSQTSFDEFSVSPLSLKGIKDAGYTKMTVVQEATLPVILKGTDVLAKARTGTGKTVAFLLPSIEVVVKTPPVDRDEKRPPIIVLVICPTRELANQAAAEAKKLLKYHPSIGAQVVIGGTRLALEQKRMQVDPCQILVATPGRLKDHIENTPGFATRMKGVKVLVLDEADHLLDMGFRKDIERIIAAVPKQRQTLLFSATVPPEVRQICHVALKRDHEFINTVQEGAEETHAQVRQTHLVAPLDNQFSLLYTLLRDHIADDVEFKVLVFCTTAMVTKLVADLLGELKMNVREIHSRKSQTYRTRVSDEFRKSKGLILVTSDVSARGVDYPDVTLVIQMGLPSDRQQYIHRLGRTGRKGKEGEGVLLLAPWEQSFLTTIKDLPITKGTAPAVDPDAKKKVERALSNVEMKSKESAYQAWLGYYNSNKDVGRDKSRLVELANEFSRSMGLDNPPVIPKMILGKMGLKNVPGLRSK